MPRHIDKTLIQFLVFMGVMILWGILDRLKKRGRAQGSGETGTTTETRQPPTRTAGSSPADALPPLPRPARKTDWEEELRRLLGGDQSSPPPTPPLIVYEQPRPTPPSAEPARMTRPPLTRAVTMRTEPQVATPVPVPGFAESIQAYQRASQLDVKMAEHLSQIAEQVRTHSAGQKVQAAAADIVQGVSFVRDPQSIRSALVASMILGPPRGLEI